MPPTCSDAFPRNKDTEQVQRVCGCDPEDGLGGTRWLLAAGIAQALHGLRHSELLAERAAYEAAAAYLPTRLEAPQHGDEIAPLGGVGFSCEQLTEDDTVTAKQHARVALQGGLVAMGFSNGLLCGVGGQNAGGGHIAEEGPAPGRGSCRGTLA